MTMPPLGDGRPLASRRPDRTSRALRLAPPAPYRAWWIAVGIGIALLICIAVPPFPTDPVRTAHSPADATTGETQEQEEPRKR